MTDSAPHPVNQLMKDFRIGVDLGGTKIEAAALDRSGSILVRYRRETPQGNYGATLDAIAALVTELETRLGAQGSVGVAIPGAISPATGLVKNANSVWLIGEKFDRDLSDLLARPVRVENDANCFALSEAVDGSAKAAITVFGVILGTGVGGGHVVNGEIVGGANAIGGEWGHNPLPWPAADEIPGPPCYCGLRGCIETFLSGPGLMRDYLDHTNKQLTAETIAGNAATGDPAAEAAMARYEDRLARGLATVINLLDPDCIVLGGGLSNISRLYENVPRLWDDYVFSDTVATRLVPPAFGDSSGVRGAAWLWPEAP